VGGGTTFSLYFPHCTSVALARIISSAPPTGRARVLVVDDEPIQLRTARRVLVHLGYEVETASGRRQALELFRPVSGTSSSVPTQVESRYDLVILDMILNDGYDGLQISERIRALFPDQRVIIASGHAPTDRTDLAVHQGVPWLVKPYTAESLAKSVRAALRSTSR
jgi:CheY-like chemotaxis protein